MATLPMRITMPKPAKPLPAPNSDFYELAETLPAEELAVVKQVSSPLKVHGVAKVPAKRAPNVGEHNDGVLMELGFTKNDIEGLRASGTIPAMEQELSAAD